MIDNETAETAQKTSSDIKFLYINRARNNQTINRILWGCIVVGPLLALGLVTGVFFDITYTDCVLISGIEAMLAFIHLLLYKKWPASKVTSYFCLLFMDCLIFYMSYLHVSIHISYFIVPLLSLFYCDKKIYCVSSAFNFGMMILSLWFAAVFHSGYRTDLPTAMSWFLTRGMGFCIEYICMFGTGFALGATLNSYYKTMYEDKKMINKGAKVLKEIEKRTEKLIELSNTDELTGVKNRRAYEEDLKNLTMTSNRVVVVVDINGLKTTNDSIGHDAGDELIIGTAQCLSQVFGENGSVYRIGGDEFVCLFSAEKKEMMKYKERFARVANDWKGEKIEKLSMSIGYALAVDNPDLSIYELARLADRKMYADKEEYYRVTGAERRKV